MIDLDNEEHRKALLSACAARLRGAGSEDARANSPILKASSAEIVAACDLMHTAYDAVDDPAKTAELIRRLVERAEVSCAVYKEWRTPFPRPQIVITWNPYGEKRYGVIPFLMHERYGRSFSVSWTNGAQAIARLLALAPGAGADAVLAALRGES